jgi:hypothetical protein
MIGRWRALPPTKVLHKHVEELEQRLKDFDKSINELRWEKKAIQNQIDWLKKRIDKENDPKERSNIELSKEPS